MKEVRIGERTLSPKELDEVKNVLLTQVLNRKLTTCKFCNDEYLCKFYLSTEKVEGCFLVPFRNTLTDVEECKAVDKENVTIRIKD